MTLTEQQIGPVLSDYHEGRGGLEAAIWMANAIALPATRSGPPFWP